MVKIYCHFGEAIRPEELPCDPAAPFEDPLIQYTTKFSIWARRRPRYHPLFASEKEQQKDVGFIGFDFRPAAMTDSDVLAKASKFVWQHRHEVPNPTLLKAWMADEVDIEGKPNDGVVLDMPTSIFNSFVDWDRFHQYILDQKRASKDNIEISKDLLAQHKNGTWVLPEVIIQTCERFQTKVLAHDYVDFATPQVDEEHRPEINLKKSVTRKKISKRQLARLEDIVIYLLLPALRIGLTGKLVDKQTHYLARAAKWLRPASDPVWKKPWTDGLDLLALMVMDRKNSLELDFVRQVSNFVHAHIDDAPDFDRMQKQTASSKPSAILKQKTVTPADTELQEEKNTNLMRRLILNPDIKNFPGSDVPKDLILTRMGILTADTVIDEERLIKFEALIDKAYKRRNDPDFWVMNQLDMTVMLMNDIIDLDGNIIGEELEVTPFLRMELRHGAERKLWNKVAGLWLYPHAKKPLPDILTKHEAETLQIICYWLDKKPRSPRPFFWAIQDMVWGQFNGDPTLVGDRMRELAIYIHEHRNDPPNCDVLKLV